MLKNPCIVGEIIGGSQREEMLEVLKDRMKQMGIPIENLQWYLDLCRFGSAPQCTLYYRTL